MSIKYKIEDAKKNKNLINDEIKLSKIKSKDVPSGARKLRSRNKMTLDKLAKIVTDGFERQEKFNISIHEDLNRVVKLNNLKY